MSVSYRYQIQRLDGYTDGKPSWMRERVSCFSREEAEAKIAELKAQHPKATYRVRQISKL